MHFILSVTFQDVGPGSSPKVSVVEKPATARGVTHVIAANALTKFLPHAGNRLYFSPSHSHQTRTQTPADTASAKHPATMVYIRQDKLPKLKEYKYSGVDHSLLSQYVLKPFYTHVVINCFPMWMA